MSSEYINMLPDNHIFFISTAGDFEEKHIIERVDEKDGKPKNEKNQHKSEDDKELDEPPAH